MTDVQVVIIGGGAMGVSLAYHLGKCGWRDVVLLEKNDLTHGSTWHAAGLCTHFAHNATIQELRARSVRLYRDILPKETGQSCGFHASGAMRITRSLDRMHEFRHVAGLSAFTGYPLEILDVNRIAELHPLAQLDGLIGGIYEPDDGHVDPTLAVQAMARVADGYGVSIRRYEPVRRITRERSWVVETDKGVYRAQHVVNAAGTWGYEVGQMMGVNVPSVPVLHQYLVTDTVVEVAERTTELPIIRDPEESWYVRQERDGLILGPYETDAQIWSPDLVPPEFGADLLPADLDRVEHIIEAAMARIPALGKVGIKTVVNGPITFSPDANPLIGPAAGMPGAWLMTGSSMGVMEGGGAGWFLSEWMTKGAAPMDALAVDPRRFGAWADRSYRIEKARECFGLQFGVHYPFEERPAARGKRLSPLHDLMIERGAVMGAAHGWERPNWFSDRPHDRAENGFERVNWFDRVASEVDTVTNVAGIADLSVFSKFEVLGADCQAFLERLGCNRPPNVGRVALTHPLTSEGGVAAEFCVARLAENHAYLTSAAAAEEMDLDLLNACSVGLDVAVRNVTDDYGVIGLMGPQSATVLKRCVTGDLGSWLSVRKVEFAGCKLRAIRMSYVGELGWELHGARDDMPIVFKALEDIWQEFGIGFFGAFAMNSMRLEKGYRAWGMDMTTERGPLEADLDAFVQDKGALRKEWSMVQLDIEGTGADPFYAHPVLSAGEPIGIVTSGVYGHRTGRVLALAYLRARPKGALEVEVLGRRRPARILVRPPFDPDNTRMKG